jgi:ABC-2 type transport system permease protein
MRPELIVAGKEFRDHLTSKRFLVIFAILMLLAVVSMAGGMAEYNKMLDDYKKSAAQNSQQDWFKEQVASLQKQIADSEASGASQEEIDSLKYQLDMMINPPMPSVLYVFTRMNQYLVLIALVLSVAMGFDLITREKEEGSLKSLLSHPVYRDSVINGKLLGSLAVLIVVMCSMFLVTIAIMLFYGAVPVGDDLLRIGTYFVMALIYSGVFFAIATMTSTIAKSSALSILYVLSIVVILVMVTTFSSTIADAIMGPVPEYTYPVDGDVGILKSGNGSIVEPALSPISSSKVIGWNPEIQQYYEKKNQIIEAINTISPLYDFSDRISYAILSKADMRPMPLMAYDMAYSPYRTPTLMDSLASVWTNILAMLIELILPLAVSYVMFMRSDIR